MTKPSHNVILSEAKNLRSDLDRSSNGDKQIRFAEPVLSKAEGLNITEPLM